MIATCIFVVFRGKIGKMSKGTVEAFQFKRFSIEQDKCAMKVGMDGILLGAWADVKNVTTALDVGTGTGVIAIMLAQRTTDTLIHAVEIDGLTCEQAAANMSNCPWSDRLTAINASIQEYARQADQTYDLIVSNPPFFTGGTFSNNQNKNNVRHTVKLPHGDLLAAVRTLLAPNGKFCLILPLIEGLRFREVARSYNLYCTKMTEVLPKVDRQVERLLIQFEKKEVALVKDKLVIQNAKTEEWTKEYVQLTKAFYLHM